MVVETQSQIPSRPDSRAAAVLAALAVLVGSWTLLHVGFYAHDQIKDTPVYQRYGDAIARGEVPYRDFGVEYPPGALPVFALPGLAEPGTDQNVTTGFRHAFETLMWLCAVALLPAIAIVLHATRASPRHLWTALGFAALAPLALGSVVLSRFDLWPAALVAVALAALVSDRVRLGSGLLGLGVAAKLYPVVLVPLAVVHVWKRYGRREAILCIGVLAAVVAAVFLPFVIVAPGGVWDSLSGQLTRPLQLESLGSGVLLALHQAFGLGVHVETSHGSQNLAGTGPDAVALVLSVVQALVLLGIWVTFARGPGGRRALVAASAAVLVAFVALGKVLSPQFLIWLIPVVPLVRGRAGARASALLGVALVLTQLWFPFRYWHLAVDLDPLTSWLVLARDLVLVALLAVLVAGLRREGGSADDRIEGVTERRL